MTNSRLMGQMNTRFSRVTALVAAWMIWSTGLSAYGASPTVVISSEALDPTNASPIPVTVTFSEPVTGFTSGDVNNTNAFIGNFVGSGSSYSFELTPVADGAVTSEIPAGAAQNVMGEHNLASSQFSRTFDSTAPTVTISSASPDPTDTSPIPVTVTFSEDVTGFIGSDVSTTNAIVSGFTAVDGKTYTFNLVPSGEGVVTADVNAGAAQDAAGNGNTAANTFTRIYDVGPPTVTISSTATNPTNASPIPVTITFSEDVTGFQLGDIGIGNGSLSNFSAVSGSVYTVDLTPASQGVVTVDVDAGVAVDAAGNGNTAAGQFSRIFDSAGPFVTMSSSAPNPTNASPISITVTFSEPVTGFTGGDVSRSNATVSNFTAADSSTYTFDLTPNQEGEVTASIAEGVATDTAGNGNVGSSLFSRIYDLGPPTVTLSSSASNPTFTSPIPITITLSEAVSGFTSSDMAASNGIFSGFTQNGPTEYTVDLTPTSEGPVTVSVGANTMQDSTGTGNGAAQLAHVYYSSDPTPQGVAANSGAFSIHLTWIPSSVSRVNGYNVYRDTSPVGSFSLKVNPSLVTAPSFADGPVTRGETYYYKVSSVTLESFESGLSPAASATAGKLFITMPDVRGAVGGIIRLPLSLSEATGVSGAGMDIRVTYNPSLLTPTAVERTTLTETVTTTDNVSTANGEVVITGAAGAALSGAGRLFDIVFDVDAGAASGATSGFAFSNVSLSDASLTALPVDSSDTATFTVSPIHSQGDVNGDGVVNANDVTLALKFADGSLTPTALELAAGDFTSDGVIDSADIVLLRRLIADLALNPGTKKAGSVTEKGAGSYLVSVGDVAGEPGELVSVPIVINTMAGVAGVDLTLIVDSLVFDVTGVNTTSLTSSFSSSWNEVGGVLDIAMGSASAAGGGSGTLCTVDLVVSGTPPAGDTPLNLAYVKLSGEFGEDLSWTSTVEGASGVFGVSGFLLGAAGVTALSVSIALVLLLAACQQRGAKGAVVRSDHL